MARYASTCLLLPLKWESRWESTIHWEGRKIIWEQWIGTVTSGEESTIGGAVRWEAVPKTTVIVAVAVGGYYHRWG